MDPHIFVAAHLATLEKNPPFGVQLRRSCLIIVHLEKTLFPQKTRVLVFFLIKKKDERQLWLGGRPHCLGAGFGAAAFRSTKVTLSTLKAVAMESSISWVPLSLSPSLACGGCPPPLPPFPFSWAVAHQSHLDRGSYCVERRHFCVDGSQSTLFLPENCRLTFLYVLCVQCTSP